MGYIFNSSLDYSNFGQGLQTSLASSAMYILVTIALVIFIIAVMISGFKQVASRGRLKWLLLHALSLFLIAYFLKDLTINKYLEVLILTLGVTCLSTVYRYLMLREKKDFKLFSIWFGINFVTLLIVMILFETLGVTSGILQLFFASFCLTFVGSAIHPTFKGEGISYPRPFPGRRKVRGNSFKQEYRNLRRQGHSHRNAIRILHSKKR